MNGVNKDDVELGNVEIKESAPLKHEFEEQTKPRFTGYKRDELLEIANQPKWKRARMFLFVFFWVIWVVLLAAAVLLVINADKCKPMPKPKWYQDTVLYQMDHKQLSDNGLQGVTDNVKYLKNLKSSILMTNMLTVDPNTLFESEKFSSVIDSLHNAELKVLVDMPISSVSVNDSNDFEVSTSEEDCQESEKCNLFQWGDEESEGFSKITKDDKTGYYRGENGRATINYNNQFSHNYLADAIKKLAEKKVNGVYLSDIDKIINDKYNISKIITTAWSQVLKINEGLKEDQTEFALFVGNSAMNNDLASLYQVSNVTKELGSVPNPIFVHDSIDVNDFNNVQEFVEKIKASRENRRTVSSYQNNGMDSNIKNSLAQTLVNIAIPGVPIVMQGEELGNKNAEYSWKYDGETKYKPTSTSDRMVHFALDTVTSMIKKTKVETLSKESLRYDTQNNDTFIKFYSEAEIGNNNLFVMCRRWFTKPAVLVMSTFNSPSQVTFNAMNFTDCQPEFAEAKATVLLSNDMEGDFKKGKEVEVQKLTSLPSHTTIIFTV